MGCLLFCSVVQAFSILCSNGGLDLILQLTRCFLNVKVMAMSGMEDRKSALSTAKLLGVRHTLQKPFRMDTLLKIIDYELIH